MNPNVTYPKNAPIIVGIIHMELFTMLRPAPPFSTGLLRNPGSQVKSPQ